MRLAISSANFSFDEGIADAFVRDLDAGGPIILGGIPFRENLIEQGPALPPGPARLVLRHCAITSHETGVGLRIPGCAIPGVLRVEVEGASATFEVDKIALLRLRARHRDRGISGRRPLMGVTEGGVTFEHPPDDEGRLTTVVSAGAHMAYLLDDSLVQQEFVVDPSQNEVEVVLD